MRGREGWERISLSITDSLPPSPLSPILPFSPPPLAYTFARLQLPLLLSQRASVSQPAEQHASVSMCLRPSLSAAPVARARSWWGSSQRVTVESVGSVGSVTCCGRWGGGVVWPTLARMEEVEEEVEVLEEEEVGRGRKHLPDSGGRGKWSEVEE